jgi:hypothetical protein
VTLGAEPNLLCTKVESLDELAPGLKLTATLLPSLCQMSLNRSPSTEFIVMLKHRVAKIGVRKKIYKCWIQMGKIPENPVTLAVSLYKLQGELIGSYSCEWNWS